jgi:hypothetical protein
MNTLANYSTPYWISIAFSILIFLPFLLLLQFVFNHARQANKHSWFVGAVLFYLLYVTYIGIAHYAGLFDAVALPPRVLVFTTFPYAVFLFVFFTRTTMFKYIQSHSSVKSLVSLHLFRIVGIFFIVLAAHQSLPKLFAFIAGFGDVITAITSVWVVRAIAQKKSYAKKLTMAWNIFGTVDILFTAIAANVLTKLSIDTGSMGVDKLAEFPFCIIPAFAPPTILFLHWLIFKALKKENTIV